MLFAASMFLSAPDVFAEGDKAAAETLFQAGITLMNEGKYPEACLKFAESQRADPSSGTLLNLGSCYEKTGRPASAWATFKEAAVMARAQGQTDREATANARIAALEPTLSTLRIDAGDMPGMVVKRGGMEVGRGSLGVPIAVDPGEHVITAAAPDHEEWKATVMVGPNADAKAVTVPPLRKIEPIFNGNEGAAPAEPAPGSRLRTVGLVVGGAGIAVLGAGAIFGGLALGDQGNADVLCPQKKCSAEGQDLIDSASTKALVSTLGFGIGLAAVGAGVTLYFIGSSAGEEGEEGAEGAPSARIAPWVGSTGGGLFAIGRF